MSGGRCLGRHKFIFLYLCLLAWNCPLLADTPDSGRGDGITRISQGVLIHGPVEPVLWYYESPRNDLTLEEAMAAFESGEFTRAPAGFNGGFTESAYWFHFTLLLTDGGGPEPSTQEVYLELEYPHIDWLQVFKLSAAGPDTPEPLVLGDLLDFSRRPIPVHEFVLPARLEAGEPLSFWIHVKSSNLMQMPVSVWQKDRFLQAFGELNLVNGMFFGLVVIMALYNLFIGIMIRDRTFILYFCYFGVFGLFVFSYFGFGFQYLWPGVPRLNDYSLPVLAFVMQSFGILFSRSFLDTPNENPRVNLVLLGAVGFCLAMIPLCFLLSYRAMITVAISSGLVVAILVNLAGIISLLQGRKHARFYVVGWSSVMVGWVVFNLAQKDILPLNFFTLHAVQFGAILEVLFLSLALGDQINRVTEEKNRVQSQAKAELQQKNSELKDMLQRVRESNELKDQFLATISHELRTPMNGVEGALEMLDDLVNREAGQEPLRAARNSAHLMTQILESLLEFSELQSGKFELMASSFVLADMVNEAVTECASLARAKGVDFNVSINGPDNRYLLADGVRIQHLLFQLADNAVKFTEKGYINVDVSLQTDQGQPQLCLAVEDSGIGVDKETQSVIFEKFRQADGSFSRRHGGLGIGLTLVKSLTHKLGGELTFMSEPGKGTRVDIHLPVSLGDPLPATPATEQSLSPAANGRVLIVEDNPVNQMTLKALVKKLGYDVETANNGQEAIELTGAERFDCILMDCQMPVVDGFAATEMIRHGAGPNTDTPIVAVTANAMSSDKQRCLQAGMNDYIKKPVSKAVISDKLAFWTDEQGGRKAAV